jgi:hypothetical protein
VVVADVLQGGGNGFDQVVLFDEGGHGAVLGKTGQGKAWVGLPLILGRSSVSAL